MGSVVPTEWGLEGMASEALGDPSEQRPRGKSSYTCCSNIRPPRRLLPRGAPVCCPHSAGSGRCPSRARRTPAGLPLRFSLQRPWWSRAWAAGPHLRLAASFQLEGAEVCAGAEGTVMLVMLGHPHPCLGCALGLPGMMPSQPLPAPWEEPTCRAPRGEASAGLPGQA